METAIFLCHAREDTEQVLKYYHRLKNVGFKPWIDAEDLLPGEYWRKEIPKAIKHSDFALLFLSKTSISKKGYVQKEIQLALEVLDEMPEGHIFVIPVRLNDCEVPDRLKDLHYVDLFVEEGFTKVVNSIKSHSLNKSTPPSQTERTQKPSLLEMFKEFVEQTPSLVKTKIDTTLVVYEEHEETDRYAENKTVLKIYYRENGPYLGTIIPGEGQYGKYHTVVLERDQQWNRGLRGRKWYDLEELLENLIKAKLHL